MRVEIKSEPIVGNDNIFVSTAPYQTSFSCGLDRQFVGGILEGINYPFNEKSDSYFLRSKLCKNGPSTKLRDEGINQRSVTISSNAKASAAQNASHPRLEPVHVVQGDGTPDDATCQRYGYKPNQSDYAGCRLQLDQARQTAAREQERYNEELARYQQQVVELERQQRQDRAMRQFEGAMRLLAGQGAGGSSSTNYQAPPPPQAPTTYQTIRLPNGSQVYCTVTGSYTSCN